MADGRTGKNGDRGQRCEVHRVRNAIRDDAKRFAQDLDKVVGTGAQHLVVARHADAQSLKVRDASASVPEERTTQTHSDALGCHALNARDAPASSRRVYPSREALRGTQTQSTYRSVGPRRRPKPSASDRLIANTPETTRFPPRSTTSTIGWRPK